MSVGSMQVVIANHYRKSGDLLPFGSIVFGVKKRYDLAYSLQTRTRMVKMS